MMNKFLAISLIVMIAFADASPLLKSWHAKQQRRMKSGAMQKASLQSSHQDKTTTITLSTTTGGSRGRKLSLSEPIEVVVNNLVGGDGPVSYKHIRAQENKANSGVSIVL